MTVIAGVARNGRVYLGADGATLQGDERLRFDRRTKVWVKGEFIMGTAGTYYGGQVIEHLFDPPAHESGVDPLAYMIRDFAQGLRTTVKKYKAEEKENDNTVMQVNLLVGYRGALYEVDSGYGVLTPSNGFHAIGCACQIALGAMYALRDADPEAMITTALEASAEFDPNIRPPFTVECVTYRTERRAEELEVPPLAGIPTEKRGYP